MKNLLTKHKRKLILAGTVVVLLIGITVFFALNTRSGNMFGGGLRVFYYNPAEGMLEGVSVNIPALSRSSQIERMIAHFYNPPRNTALEGLWPQWMAYTSIVFYGDLVGIAFPPEYRRMTAMEEALFRTGLTLTLTTLPFIDRVLVWVDGEGEKPPVPFEEWVRDEEMWDMNAVAVNSTATVINNPQISAGVVQPRTFVLYFVCAEGEGLITEIIEDDYVDTHRLAEFKLQYLIAGPSAEGAMRLIPPETRVRQVMYDPVGRSLYVDFSGDFMSRFSGSQKLAQLMLQSIVNTLTLPANNEALTRVNRVFFTVDSERYEVFHGVGNFNLGFELDHDFVLVDEEEPDEEYDPENGEEEDDVPVGPRGDEDE
jgi:hypothetical protein